MGSLHRCIDISTIMQITSSSKNGTIILLSHIYIILHPYSLLSHDKVTVPKKINSLQLGPQVCEPAQAEEQVPQQALVTVMGLYPWIFF